MPYIPKFSHLFKVLLRVRDRQAAEGLFLEGSIEFESGDPEAARRMFLYGTRLDPAFAGNFYNLAVAMEKLNGASRETVDAWEAYLHVAESDSKQSEETRQKVRQHVRDLKAEGGNPADGGS